MRSTPEPRYIIQDWTANPLIMCRMNTVKMMKGMRLASGSWSIPSSGMKMAWPAMSMMLQMLL